MIKISLKKNSGLCFHLKTGASSGVKISKLAVCEGIFFSLVLTYQQN